jgi:hypothetical protein
MKTYLTLFGLLLCVSFRCMSQQTLDYPSCRQWIEEWVGGTNQTPGEERIFVCSHSPEYAAIVQYRKGITLREIIDQIRFRNATLIVLVMRTSNSENSVLQKVTPSDSPDLEIKKTDVIWLFNISPPLWLASCPTPP